jgi:deoxyribonuclease-4
MPFFGAHISISGGIYNAPLRAQLLDCGSMQIFCKNQRMWRMTPLSDDDISLFVENVQKTRIKIVCVHSSYLINPGAPDRNVLRKSRKSFLQEIKRTGNLRIPYFIIHPGAHLGDGEDNCVRRIAESIDWVVERIDPHTVTILLETTAGQGTQVGYTFEHLRDIISLSHYPESIGICFDTCHSFAAGYDIRNSTSLRRTFADFDKIIGLKKLLVFHLNDSKRDIGSRIDRHEHIGRGKIGLEGFRCLVNEKRFKNLPMIIETPNEKSQDERNLKLLKRLVGERKSFLKS